MENTKKLDRWAEKLLDTGKRNNLINFRDYKTSSAEVVYPDCDRFFDKCSLGHQFTVYDPHITDEDDDIYGSASLRNNRGLNKETYKALYTGKIKNEKTVLLYAQGANPITAIKRIAKKARDQADETGINVAYLAFGFVKWNEVGSTTIYKAPLLLVHINIITGSILDPVKIEISDDDIVVNPTFHYLLNADYGLKLPDFKDDDTLSSYLARASRVVSKIGWEIVNECKVGIFSFLKINMYEDLKNNAKRILSNDIINTLIGERSIADDLPYEMTTLEDNPLIDLHAVIDADSSQIEAIEMAKHGDSFVLQGPPGTGKSQTITNIIAECLYDGKKVLFVSEKQAALNVVYDKLKKANLADFCLELHSHKANKKAVIDELNRTLELPKTVVSSSAQSEIRQKKDALKILDDYEKELHRNRAPINKSLYELFEVYTSKSNAADFSVQISNIDKKGEDYLHNALDLLEQYAAILPSIGYDYTQNTWYGFSKTQLSYDESMDLLNDFETILNGLKELEPVSSEISNRYEITDLNYIRTLKWIKLLQFFGTSDIVTPVLLSKDKCEIAVAYVADLEKNSKRIKQIYTYITEKFSDRVFQELDAERTYKLLSEDYKNIITRMFNSGYKDLIARIQTYAISGSKIKYRDAYDLSYSLLQYFASLEAFQKLEIEAKDYLGSCYAGHDTNWDHLSSGVSELYDMLSNGMPSLGLIPGMTVEQFKFCQSTMCDDSQRLSECINRIQASVERVNGLFEKSIIDFEKDDYSKCINKLQACIDNFEELSVWKRFKELIGELSTADLGECVNYVMSEEPDPTLIVPAYEKAFYKTWIDYILNTVPELGGFSRRNQDTAIKIFKSKDALQYEISKYQINAKLSSLRPNLNLVSDGSAVGILRAEGQKKRKQMPIRRLLSETGGLVQTIKPCFLMSPLSVSTFLESDKINFDTVIFDEASQIFPQDALGAIYRGKQLIVVGDSKQMPPSNFFSSSTDVDEDDEDDIYDITDFESILDVCSSIFNTQNLAWHYRSRFEQLIAFSNVNFYNNNLVTFPSATENRTGVGVDYYHVDGVFDRPSKTNIGEARFIVEQIYEHIKTYPKRSLGVVAFSVAQQNLIDKLLTKKRENSPEYEWFFTSEGAEPFFIKNLETVQGDERDTIIFSVAYARDAGGRFIHNFGPLNREGGERRLNVAVTRAKYNVQLVSSIHYTDINLDNTKSEGVRLLRSYLEYAQNGDSVIERVTSPNRGLESNSQLEGEICDFLKDRGFAVDTRIGYSEDKIDIGLRKEAGSNYLIAIECDGPVYHNSKNARDRDCLRQRVLENMGWKYYRVWSTDWYKNKEFERSRLLQYVWDVVDNKVAPATSASESTYSRSMLEQSNEMKLSSFVTTVTEQRLPFEAYVETGALGIIQRNAYFQGAIREILNVEAPLSEEYLLKRIVNLFNREKVTKVVIEQFNTKMYGCDRYGIVRRNGYLYINDSINNVLRVPGSNVLLYKLRIPGSTREIKYIAPEELAGGMYELIKQNDTVTKDGLYKYMTNILGFSRTGDAIVEKYEQALSILIRAKLVKKNKDQLSLMNGG